MGLSTIITLPLQGLSSVLVPGWASGRHGGEVWAVPPGHCRGPLNEVVCGALMLAFERAGRCGEVILNTCEWCTYRRSIKIVYLSNAGSSGAGQGKEAGHGTQHCDV